jgi:ketosteroid isomerase-like protein
MTWLRLLALSGAILFFSPATALGVPLSEHEKHAILANIHAYRDAWLAGDPRAVMATLVKEAVLLPSGLEPVVGEEAIRAFWWPAGGPPTKVSAMELELQGVAGNSDLAHAWGSGSLTFAYQQDGQEHVVSVRSTFLNVLEKQGDGQWKTVCRMWSDLRRR